MRKVLVVFISIVQFGLASANQDSLRVDELLTRAAAAEETDSSLFYADEALAYAKAHHYPDGMLAAAQFFGKLYAQTGELNKSIELYQNLLKSYAFDAKQRSTAYNQIGVYHVYMGHYDSTETYFLKALKIREDLKDSIGVGASLNNLGNVLMTTGDYAKATDYFIRSLKIREAISDSAGIASSTNNLGLIYYKQQKYDEAIRYYHIALKINQGQGINSKGILILINLGNIYDEMHELDSAVSYFNVAINQAETFGDARLKSMVYGNMGVTQDKIGNYDLAKSYYKKALKIRIESDDLEGQAIIYNNLGGVHISTKNYREAIEYFTKSLSFSEQINFLEATRDNYLGLSTAYEKMGNHQQAVEAYNQYIVLKDSMFNEATNQQIEALNVQYQTERKEKEIAEQKLLISEQQLKNENRYYLLLGVGLAALFILITGGFVYRNQKQKQLRLIKENKLKDELAAIAMQNEVHQERLRISTTLNENIGSQLTFILTSVDNIMHRAEALDGLVQRKLSELSVFAKSTITQLRDTIWALNKEELSFEDLKARLYDYVSQANIAQEHMAFSFESGSHLNYQLNTMQGVNIFRIVQEAINNAMKYAAATNVTLRVEEKEDQLCIKITDDGIGFDMAEITLGNGLENMENRAKAIHAAFEINSAPQKGTEILLAIHKTRLTK
ncbi:MAG: tetratricopeptide repeat protein [Flavobacteriales bacterium]|nr:tetratricopeptide repeat protein [Flavobacteriales bacterium]